MKVLTKKWIVLYIIIIVVSFYNGYNALLNIHYWLSWIILIFSVCCFYGFGLLLGIRTINFSVKKFKEWILNIVKEGKC